MANNSNSSNSGSGGLGFAGVLQIVFIVLKLLGKINWSWFWVLSPIWTSLILVIIGGTIFYELYRAINKKNRTRG